MALSRDNVKNILRNPYTQNFVVGILIGLTGGLYVALNLLGAAGGKPQSASTINTANAVLCACYAISSFLAGTVLNRIGPAWTGFFGIIGYILYIGSLWHFDKYAQPVFPLVAAACLGLSAGLIYVTQGYVSMSYSEENERGKFVAIALNLQATGAVIGGFIPLMINRNKAVSAGVPPSVYIIFIVMDFVGCALAFLLAAPNKVVRKDGTNIAEIQPRTIIVELKGTLTALKDWRLWLMIPAFLPSQVYLVYGGSVNVYLNSLRARSLLSFCAVVVQIICAWALQWVLDHPKWSRRTRAISGLFGVGIPLMAAWIWDTIRVRNYNRHQPRENPVDWNDSDFGPVFVLFMLNWTSSALWQYIIMYFLGCFTNNPRHAANNAGVFRGLLAVGEAIAFAVDSRKVAYLIESGIILAFYALGFLTMGYLAFFVVEETKYFAEDEVTIPKHVVEEMHGHKLDVMDKNELETGDQIPTTATEEDMSKKKD